MHIVTKKHNLCFTLFWLCYWAQLQLDSDWLMKIYHITWTLGLNFFKACQHIVRVIELMSSNYLFLFALTGMSVLGGHAIFLSPDDMHLGVSETVKDTSRYVSWVLYCSVIWSLISMFVSIMKKLTLKVPFATNLVRFRFVKFFIIRVNTYSGIFP